ncbi:DUF892 family protein [Mucilaginibacter sp.]
MAYNEQWLLHGDTQVSILNKKEVTSIFVDTLTDIYTVKGHLLDYLPLMARKATARSLKLAILDTSIDIKAQLLRLDMVMKMLKKISHKTPRQSYNDFNLNTYMNSGLDIANPYKTDVALLTHLIMIEGIQITTFTLMKKMSHAFGNNTISDLINENLKDSMENQIIFDAMMNDCLVTVNT